MGCAGFDIWRPIPAGSILKAKATGEDTAYNASIAVFRNGTASVIRHEQLTTGDVSVTSAQGDRFVLDPALILFRDVDQPVTIEMWFEDEQGNDVMISAPSGGQRPARCDWSLARVRLSPMLAEIVALGA